MNDQKFEQLKKLKELVEQGILTQEEMDKEKAKILSEEDKKKDAPNPQFVITSEMIKPTSLLDKLKNIPCLDEKSRFSIVYLVLVGILGLFLLVVIPTELRLHVLYGMTSIMGILAISRTKSIKQVAISALLLFIPLYFMFTQEYDSRIGSYWDVSSGGYWFIIAVINIFMPLKRKLWCRILVTALLLIGTPGFWSRALEEQFFLFILNFVSILWAFWTNEDSISIKKLVTYLNRNRIKVAIIAAIIIAGTIGYVIVSSHMEEVNAERREALQKKQEAERARQDSIAEVKRIENEKKAAQARALQLSISKEQHAEDIKRHTNVGLVVTEISIRRGRKNGESTKGILFRAFNPTQKIIKYVICTLQGVNGVDDICTYEHTCRGIGPVDPHEICEWNFDDVFTDPNDIIKDFIGYFKVVYTDGSSKNVRFRDAKPSSGFTTEWWD